MNICPNIISQSLDNVPQSRDIPAVQVYEEFIFIFVEPGRSGLNVGQVDPFFLEERS